MSTLELSDIVKDNIHEDNGYVFTSDGTYIWYKHRNIPSAPTMVFASGNGVNHTELETIREIYEEAGWSTLTYDPRGTGRSQKVLTADAYRLQSFSDDLTCLMTELDINDGTKVFMGQSVGAMTGIVNQVEHGFFDAFVCLTPSHDYKKTLRDEDFLFNVAKKFVKKGINTLKVLSEDPERVNELKANGNTLGMGLSFSRTPLTAYEIAKAETEFLMSEPADFTKVGEEKFYNHSEYVRSLYFDIENLQMIIEKNPILKSVYKRFATFGKYISRLSTDLKVKVKFMNGHMSRVHNISNQIAKAALMGYNIEDALSKVDVPVLLIGGEMDIYIDQHKVGANKKMTYTGIIITSNGDEKVSCESTMYGLIGSEQKDVVMVPGATHTMSLTHPNHVAYHSADFLGRVMGEKYKESFEKVKMISEGSKYR